MESKEFKDRQPKERNAEQALQTLQWLCSKMERCESDVRRSLYRWKVPREDWDGVISKLIKDRFVDNERYAAAYTREKVSISGWGVTKIINGLRVKGIDNEIIERVIQEYVNPADMLHKLEEFIVQRVKRESPKAKNAYDLRARVFRGAASRGFDFDKINDLLDKHIKEVEL